MSFLDDVDPKALLAACGLALMITLSNAPDPTSSTSPPPPRESAVARDKRPQTKPVVPATAALLPHRLQGRQASFRPSDEQVANARTIIRVGLRRGLPARATVIAVATSLQEAKLTNLGHLGTRNDHDSQGLFQQRPSMGWGSVKEITNPAYASHAFYRSLERVSGWQRMPLTRAAQAVQKSAFPFAYAKWEKMAADLVLAYHGAGPYAKIAKEVADAERAKAERSKKAAKAKRDKKAGNGTRTKKADKPARG